MHNERVSIRTIFALAMCAVITLFAGTHVAAQERVLHSFNNGPGNNTYGPYAGLTFDAAGNLYGTTQQGGVAEYGVVFELTPSGTGGWVEKTLHSFTGRNGVYPLAGVIVDAAGNLYGTTVEGGNTNCPGTSSCGTVFELTPAASGKWTEKVLHKFGGNATDGYAPVAGLVFDGAGNLYGTTQVGGGSSACTYGCGTVFELAPQSGGNWTEKTLHNFVGTDGANPGSSLLFDGAGNLYGSASVGGAHGSGTVFELSPQAGGWTETLLYSFGSVAADGLEPIGNLIFDAGGNLYGAAWLGGAYGNGAVFEVSPTAGGGWTETLIHNFDAKGGKDGSGPEAGVVMDAAGNLYGTTFGGGDGTTGTVYELTPSTGGNWTETILHNFHNNGKDGIDPRSSLVLDAAGNLYGTTSEGGVYSDGTAFEIVH